ncbi:two-component system, CitB family, response regulator [Pseudoalteromonas sp. BSi20652]|nr:two-component system, CitB family, response regulator [Pseudoalteromonas sp. BSi20652]
MSFCSAHISFCKIHCAVIKHSTIAFIAQQKGDLVGISCSTARCYLEYLLESGKLTADQSHGSISRSVRCYKIAK